MAIRETTIGEKKKLKSTPRGKEPPNPVDADEIWEWAHRLINLAVLAEASPKKTGDLPNVKFLLKHLRPVFDEFRTKAQQRLQENGPLFIQHFLVRSLEAIYADFSKGRITEAEVKTRILALNYEPFKNRSYLWTSVKRMKKRGGPGPADMAVKNVGKLTGYSMDALKKYRGWENALKTRRELPAYIKRTLGEGMQIRPEILTETRGFEKRLRRKEVNAYLLRKVFNDGCVKPETFDKIVEMIESDYPPGVDEYYWRRILSP